MRKIIDLLFSARRRARELDRRLLVIEANLNALNVESGKVKCYDMGSDVPEEALLRRVFNHLDAIEKYLGVRVEWRWENDPNYPPLQQPQVRVWEAVKLPPELKKSKKIKGGIRTD